MLHEPAIRPHEEQDKLNSDDIHNAVEQVLAIGSERFYQQETQRPHILSLFFLSRSSRVVATYKGRLLTDSEAAFDELDALLYPHDMLPVFRQNEEADHDAAPHIIHVVLGRVKPTGGGNRLSMILLILTVLSVLFVGTLQALAEIHHDDPARAELLEQNLGREMWRGLPYAISIMLILGAHEMGHYIMTRRHKIGASLPYFLPFPFGIFGTFGAAIRLREPIRNRKILLDVGAAGPLAGMIFAVPIVLIGLATSPVNPIEPGGFVEGNSILYALSKIITKGRFLPADGVDVYINQLAMAGWTGLLITGLNLIPIGQLDGGHILYALVGRHSRKLYYPIVLALLMLALTLATELIVFAILIMLLGNYHAVPLDDITSLGTRRRMIAFLTLVVFILVFVPMPLSPTDVNGANGASPLPTPLPDDNLIMLPVILGTLWLSSRRFWRR